MSRPKVRVWIGVDPSINRSGCAIQIGEGGVAQGAVEGLRNLGGFDLLQKLEEDLAELTPEIFLAIEFPTWSGGGTREVRTAAVQWIAELKVRFPRRVRVHKVCPKVWQPAMLEGCPGKTPQERYVKRAALFLGQPPAGEDEAAAVCLLEYGRRMHAIGAFGERPQRAAVMVAAERRKKLGRMA
ncbi:MAG: hypothetical protein ACO1SV_21765 [Fimbriimonas sp.]